jgi:hypothetical protein
MAYTHLRKERKYRKRLTAFKEELEMQYTGAYRVFLFLWRLTELHLLLPNDKKIHLPMPVIVRIRKLAWSLFKPMTVMVYTFNKRTGDRGVILQSSAQFKVLLDIKLPAEEAAETTDQ